MNMIDLRARRERLLTELERLDQLLRAFEAYAVEFAPSMLVTDDETPAAQPSPVTDGGRSEPAQRGSPINELTADAVGAAMRERGTPLTLAEVEQVAREANVPLPENGDIRNTLGVRLNRSGRFRSKRGIGWWFIDRPWPDEIGALNAHAASAPTTREVAASLVENRGDL